MKKHLTDAAIQRFRAPKEGSLEIFDLGYPGLALRIGHGGAKSFVLFHRVGGKLTRTTLGRWPRLSLADAHQAWRRVAEGKAPTVEQELTGELFATVAEQWLRLDCAPRHKASSLKVTERIVDHDLLPALGHKHIDQITRRDVAALIDSVVTRAPAKARGVHAALHRMLRWSVGRGIIASNPMDGMETPGKPSSRERVLTDAELAQVWKACDGMHGAAVRLLMLTGARREEVAQLKWSEIQDGAQFTSTMVARKMDRPISFPYRHQRVNWWQASLVLPTPNLFLPWIVRGPLVPGVMPSANLMRRQASRLGSSMTFAAPLRLACRS